MRGTPKGRDGTRYPMNITITFTSEQFETIRNTANALETNLTDIGRELFKTWANEHRKERAEYLKNLYERDCMKEEVQDED